MSEDTKRKISESRKGSTVSEETKQKIRKANLGKKLSKETKQKMSKVKLGKQKQASGFIIGRNKKELIERIAYYTKEEIQTVSDLIVNNELTNEQFAISWNDSLNEISIRF